MHLCVITSKVISITSQGKLKHSATVEFGAPIDLNVYCQVSPENPEGVLLTRAILNNMNVSLIVCVCDNRYNDTDFFNDIDYSLIVSSNHYIAIIVIYFDHHRLYCFLSLTLYHPFN